MPGQIEVTDGINVLLSENKNRHERVGFWVRCNPEAMKRWVNFSLIWSSSSDQKERGWRHTFWCKRDLLCKSETESFEDWEDNVLLSPAQHLPPLRSFGHCQRGRNLKEESTNGLSHSSGGLVLAYLADLKYTITNASSGEIINREIKKNSDQILEPLFRIGVDMYVVPNTYNIRFPTCTTRCTCVCVGNR